MGIPFSTFAGQCSGGKQLPGFVGISIAYMKSPKFLQGDGGWERVVWLPKELKERVKDAIPPELYDKIATEEDVKTTDELIKFLKERGHPCAERIGAEVVEEAVEEEEVEEEIEEVEGIEVPTMTLPGTVAGLPPGIKIVLYNAVIKAEKIVIMKEEPEKKKKKK